MPAPIGNINNCKGLNLRQKRFCKEYIIDLNATKAAERAGYSKNTANEQGARLLVNVSIKEEISKLQNKTAKKLEITHEMLTAEWAKMAFSNITHLHNTWIELKEFEQLKKDNPDILSCIQEINTKIEKRDIGDQTFAKIEYVRLKLYDKQRALENLGKNIGYYLEDNKQKIQPILYKNVSKQFPNE
jgi:phage terminase small subunit